MDDWAEIRYLFSMGQHSKREIARRVGVSRGTVDRALAVDRSPAYQREPTGSSFDAFAAQVRVLLAGTPTMPASTVAERVGWSGSASLFRAKVAELRPEYVVPDPADRLVHPPGFQSGRSFTSPDDFNEQLAAWLPVANSRFSRSRRGRPNELISIDRAAMRGLPPVAPEVVFRNSVRLPRDYYVRAFSNDYSVDPAMIGRVVEVSASLGTVFVHHDGILIAEHRRKWARHLTVTDPAHVARAAQLRAQFQTQRAHRPAAPAVVEIASLARYDELFSVDIDAAPGVLAVAL